MSEKKTVRLEDLSLDPEKYYLLLTAGTGDTLVYLGLRKYMEERWGGTMHYLIRSSHEVIMKMYGVEEFDILDFDDEGFTYMMCPRLIALSDKTPRLLKGSIWVAFHGNHHELNPINAINWGRFRMRDYFETLLQIPSSCWASFEKPQSNRISVSEDFKHRVSKIGNLSEIVLIVPEAGDKSMMTRALDSFWQREIEKYKAKGLKVIINALNPFPLVGATHLKMSLEEAIWLGLNCHSILALRSGLCDLLAYFRQKDLTVVYKGYHSFYRFNFNDFLDLRIKEMVVIAPKPNRSIGAPNKLTETKGCLFGKVTCFKLHRYSNGESIWYFLGIPILSMYTYPDSFKLRFLGITLWKTKKIESK